MNNSTVDPSMEPVPGSGGVSAYAGITAALCIIILAAFIGNILVIWTFIKTPSLKTSTNYFIVNMAVSDLLCTCFNLPLFATEEMFDGRNLISDPFATPVCKLGIYIRAVSQAVSVLSLVLIAVDRFKAIVYPLKATMFTGKMRTTFLVLSWLIPLGLGSPYLGYTEIVIVDDRKSCVFTLSGMSLFIYYVAGFIALYSVPLVVIIILYTIIIRSLRRRPKISIQALAAARRQEQNKNVMRIFIAIVAAFFICWTPLCVYNFLRLVYGSAYLLEEMLLLGNLFFYIFPSLSTAVNPVILFAFGSNYRKATKNLCSQACSFCKCTPRIKPWNASSKEEKTERRELKKVRVKYI